MKKSFATKSLLMPIVLAATVSATPTIAQAGASGNIGVVSQYFFRGIAQTQSAAGQGGLDYEHESGAYVGVWGSQVGQNQGLEYDIYGGWGGTFSGIDLGIGATYYGYTKDAGSDSKAFDSSYLEANLSVGYGPISIGYDVGNHAKLKGGKDVSYSVLTLNAEYKGAFFTYGSGDDFAGKDTDHTWFELGYGTSIAEGTDISLSIINSDKKVSNYTSDTGAESNMSMVVGITKSFDLM